MIAQNTTSSWALYSENFETYKYFRVNDVYSDNNFTILECGFINKQKQPSIEIDISKKMVIVDKLNNLEYPLVKVEGIDFTATKIKVNYGDYIFFKFYFKKLPENLKTVDLQEIGECETCFNIYLLNLYQTIDDYNGLYQKLSQKIPSPIINSFYRKYDPELLIKQLQEEKEELEDISTINVIERRAEKGSTYEELGFTSLKYITFSKKDAEYEIFFPNDSQMFITQITFKSSTEAKELHDLFAKTNNLIKKTPDSNYTFINNAFKWIAVEKNVVTIFN